ncbi:MAG TPA: hypothetical protein VFL84_12410, partial [Gammaproteobacteria bacterium]|nr:hypothetical protein [Gammaproteobacteria bacterium]
MDLRRRRPPPAALALLGLAAALTAPRLGRAQEPPATSPTPAETAVNSPMVAGESEADEPARQFVKW